MRFPGEGRCDLHKVLALLPPKRVLVPGFLYSLFGALGDEDERYEASHLRPLSSQLPEAPQQPVSPSQPHRLFFQDMASKTEVCTS